MTILKKNAYPSFALLSKYMGECFQRQDSKSAVKTVTAEDIVSVSLCVCVHLCSRVKVHICSCVIGSVSVCVPGSDWVWRLRPLDETGIHPV